MTISATLRVLEGRQQLLEQLLTLKPRSTAKELWVYAFSETQERLPLTHTVAPGDFWPLLRRLERKQLVVADRTVYPPRWSLATDAQPLERKDDA